MKKVLIIGYGSIGKRHSSVFSKLGAEVALLTKQNAPDFKTFHDLEKGLSEFDPDLIIISNETEKHISTLNELARSKFCKAVYVEKPIATDEVILDHSFSDLKVLYNLRQHPILTTLKTHLNNVQIFSANLYCGQYLPDWRAGRDYRTIYSAYKEQGGGVLRDLSHELDFATWLFGDFQQIAAMGGHLSSLEINSEDIFSILGQTEKCQLINITLNYLDRPARRDIVVNTSSGTFSGDFIRGELRLNNEIILSNVVTADTYTNQARSILDKKTEDFCQLKDANKLIRLIKAAEKSAMEKRFQTL